NKPPKTNAPSQLQAMRVAFLRYESITGEVIGEEGIASYIFSYQSAVDVTFYKCTTTGGWGVTNANWV
ncbi:hypothetical protein, partial [Photobacterium sanguinicancri]|uniref:hypothetical protein n=1 Tax=Photobacterium sanguinicancri TaxID=875932 RepID=UPI0024817AD7